MEVEMGVCGVYVHRHCEGAVIVDTATADTDTLTLTSQNTSSACAGEATESSTIKTPSMDALNSTTHF